MKLEFQLVETSQQINELCILAEEIWHEYFTAIIGKEQVIYMVNKFQSLSAITEQIKNGYNYYMIKENGILIGYTGIHKEEKSLFLSKLYLHKDSRGKGYARQAINFLVDICRENSLEKIWLTVNRHNLTTIGAYEKMGFVKVREQVADIGNGFVMDDYIMEKQI